MIKFIGKLVALTVIVLGAAYGLQSISSIPILNKQFEIIIFSCFIISLISHTIFYIGNSKGSEKSVFFSFISVGIHFILNLVFITVLIHQGVENINLFFFNFFVLYLCYTLFDIYHLIINLRQNS